MRQQLFMIETIIARKSLIFINFITSSIVGPNQRGHRNAPKSAINDVKIDAYTNLPKDVWKALETRR